MGSIPTPGTMTIRRLIGSAFRLFSVQHPLIEISVSKSALLHNLSEYQKAYPGIQIAPVLKSNAYGHGLCLIAELLDKKDIAFFMVDSLFEARQLRRHGIRSRIVVMGYVRPEDIASSSLKDTDFAIVDIEQLRSLTALATRPLRIHLKLDTGMHRQGVGEPELLEAIQLIRSNPLIEVVGVASHLGDADSTDETNTQEQLSAWRAMKEQVERAFPTLSYSHLSATKGIRFAKDAGTDVVRLGIGLYGIDTSPQSSLNLKLVLSMRSHLSLVRTVPSGDWVGYNATYRANSPRRIAIVPCGYYEGVDRALSNKGAFLVRGVVCPIVGRVSMNMSSIDVTDVPSAATGDEVLVISDRKEDPNSVVSIARLSDTIPHVILVHLPQHLRRRVGK